MVLALQTTSFFYYDTLLITHDVSPSLPLSYASVTHWYFSEQITFNGGPESCTGTLAVSGSESESLTNSIGELDVPVPLLILTTAKRHLDHKRHLLTHGHLTSRPVMIWVHHIAQQHGECSYPSAILHQLPHLFLSPKSIRSCSPTSLLGAVIANASVAINFVSQGNCLKHVVKPTS